MANVSTDNISVDSTNILAARLDSVSYPYIILLVSLVIFGGIGNALVLLSPVVEKRLRTTYHGLIVYLAATDFTVCCVVVPCSIVSQLRGYVTPFVCGVAIHLTPFLFLFALHLQCLIGYSRYKLVCSSPHLQPDVFNWKKFIASTTTCLFADALFYGVVTSLESYSARIRVQTSVALCFAVASESIYRKLVFFAVLFILPVAFVVIFYCKLFSYARTNSLTMALQQRRQARMSIILCRLFFAWFLGYVLLTVVTFLDDEAEWPDAVYKTLYLFLWLNSCINPILYGFKAKELASVFRKILFCGKMRANAVASSATVEMTPVVSILRRNEEISQQERL